MQVLLNVKYEIRIWKYKLLNLVNQSFNNIFNLVGSCRCSSADLICVLILNNN